MNRKIQLPILTMFIAATLIGSVVSISTSMTYATKSDSSMQGINQEQTSSQGSKCVAFGLDDDSKGHDKKEQKQHKQDNKHGQKDEKRIDLDGIFASCNNVAISAQSNDGNLASGQK
jgi:hypothetical protein